jgi:hypothetical protein
MRNIRKDLATILRGGVGTACSICSFNTIDNPESEAITYINCGKNKIMGGKLGHFFHTTCLMDYAKKKLPG